MVSWPPMSTTRAVTRPTEMAASSGPLATHSAGTPTAHIRPGYGGHRGFGGRARWGAEGRYVAKIPKDQEAGFKSEGPTFLEAYLCRAVAGAEAHWLTKHERVFLLSAIESRRRSVAWGEASWDKASWGRASSHDQAQTTKWDTIPKEYLGYGTESPYRVPTKVRHEGLALLATNGAEPIARTGVCGPLFAAGCTLTHAATMAKAGGSAPQDPTVVSGVCLLWRAAPPRGSGGRPCSSWCRQAHPM